MSQGCAWAFSFLSLFLFLSVGKHLGFWACGIGESLLR